jgi:cyclophilin family peptidyl-prolyl cis-trans isomerase
MKTLTRSLVLLLSLLAASLGRAENPHGLPDGLYSEITTERGVVVCELFYEKAPMTVVNHVGLAEGALGPKPRKPFYEGLKWCRVVPGLVVQGGDPTGTGDGDAGYLFPDEIVPGLRHDGMGTMQMGNDGPDTNGSQFCLMLSAQHRLNYQHNVFGRVVRGMELLPQIKERDTMRVKILRLGAAAQAFRADEATFKALMAKASRYPGPREPGPDGRFDDPDKILPKEWDRAKHFNFKLVNFERFTGIRLAARVYAKAPAAAEGDKLDGWLGQEAARLGVAKRGALAIYFANADQWHICIGTESAAHFLQSGPNGEKAAPAASVPAAVDEMLKAASARSAETVATMIKRLPPEDPITNGRRIKLKADAVLDGLIFKLETR